MAHRHRDSPDPGSVRNPRTTGMSAGLLEGKVAGTGSSRGIGAAIAKRFAVEGAKVAVHGRDRSALSTILEEIQRTGGRAIQIEGDVTRFADIEAMRTQIEQELGPVDILVANAGGSLTPPELIEQISEEGWRASVRRPHSHSRSHMPLPRPASSSLPRTSQPRQARTIFGRTALLLRPSLTERNLERIPDALQNTLLDTHAVKRLGTPEDVAAAALFLASEESAWITGMVWTSPAGGS